MPFRSDRTPPRHSRPGEAARNRKLGTSTLPCHGQKARRGSTPAEGMQRKECRRSTGPPLHTAMPLPRLVSWWSSTFERQLCAHYFSGSHHQKNTTAIPSSSSALPRLPPGGFLSVSMMAHVWSEPDELPNVAPTIEVEQTLQHHLRAMGSGRWGKKLSAMWARLRAQMQIARAMRLGRTNSSSRRLACCSRVLRMYHGAESELLLPSSRVVQFYFPSACVT